MAKKREEYVPTREEQLAYEYCVENGIRISPRGISKDDSHWYIEISSDGVNWKRSPDKYQADKLWEEYYGMCAFFYKKHKQ